MPSVSAIIPNYNYERYLPLAIESALAQTHQDLEIVVVDDGSKDGSIDVLRRFGDRVRWFAQANQGVAAARNRAILESRGDMIAVLDADDVWHPRKIERQIEAMQRPDVGLVYCWTREVDAAGNAIGEVRNTRRGDLLDAHVMLEPTVLGGGSGALIRRTCFDRVGLFDTRLSTSADWDMWRRIMTHYRVEVVPEVLLDYRQHGAGMHRNPALFARDMLRAFDNAFHDPDAARLRDLKRHAYAKLYSLVSADYFVAGDLGNAARWGLQSVALSPHPTARIVGRRVMKALSAR